MPARRRINFEDTVTFTQTARRNRPASNGCVKGAIVTHNLKTAVSQGLTNRDRGLKGPWGSNPNEAAGNQVIENTQIGLHRFHRVSGLKLISLLSMIKLEKKR